MTIIILGGLLRKDRYGEYRTGKFNYIRVLAGYYLYKNLSIKNKINLIVSGGRGIYKNILGVPPVAAVMKKELIRLGLPAKEIIEENKTASTYRELLWLKKFLDHKKEKVLVISNDYHLPRIRTMIAVIPELKKLKKYVELISAEKIAIKYNKKLKNIIVKSSKSPEMKRIIAKEKNGIKDLKSDNYKFR